MGQLARHAVFRARAESRPGRVRGLLVVTIFNLMLWAVLIAMIAHFI